MERNFRTTDILYLMYSKNKKFSENLFRIKKSLEDVGFIECGNYTSLPFEKVIEFNSMDFIINSSDGVGLVVPCGNKYSFSNGVVTGYENIINYIKKIKQIAEKL